MFPHPHAYIHIVPDDSVVKNLPAMQQMWVQSLGLEDPLEKAMATHSSILAWRIPWRRSLASYSPWSHKESDMTELLNTYTHNLCIQGGQLTGYGAWK